MGVTIFVSIVTCDTLFSLSSSLQDIDAQVDYILDNIDQKKLNEGGGGGGEEGVVLGGFKSASIERNRQLHMFQTKPAGPVAKGGVKRNGRGGGGGGGMGRRNTVAEKKKRELMVSDRDWGNWEKYSSGFAGRMMKKVNINY